MTRRANNGRCRSESEAGQMPGSRSAGQGMFGNIAHYAFSSIMRQVLGVITAFVRPMLLSPAHYGLWNLLKTIPNYTSYAHLGARVAARYEIPSNQARGLEKANEQLEGTLFWGSLILSLVPALILAAWAVFGDLSMPERCGLGIMAVYVLVWWLYEYALTLLKAYQRFTVISMANYLLPLLYFVTLPLLLIWDIYGLYVSFLLGAIGITWFFIRRQPLNVSRHFSPVQYLGLIRSGFPIMAMGLVIVMLRTVDRFVITLMLGNEMLGFYSIAVMILNFVMNIPMATREVVEPQMMQAVDSKGFVERFYLTPLYHTALYLPLIMGPVFFLMPGFIVFLLPRYQPGIPCILILALGGYFMALLYMTRGVLVAWGQQTRAALWGIPVIVTNIALAVFLVTMGGGIEGVALAASCSMAVYFFILNALIRSGAPDGTRGLRKATLMVLVPFILLLVPGFGLHVALEAMAWSFSMKLLVNMIVYYLSALWIIRFIIRKVDLLDVVALPGPVTRLISKVGHRKS